jgi:hypothetical protein
MSTPNQPAGSHGDDALPAVSTVEVIKELPFVVNGTAKEAVPSSGAVDPELMASELRLASALREVVRARAHEARSNAGASRLEQQLRLERVSSARSSPAAPRNAEGWMARVRTWLTPPLAGACAVLVVQFGVIAHLLGPQGEAEQELYRGATPPTVTSNQPVLRVTFKADTREVDLRRMLRERTLVIIAGPSDIGDYWLTPQPGTPVQDLEAAAKALIASGLVESAVVDLRGLTTRH